MQAGNCKCGYDSVTGEGVTEVRLQGEVCTVCAEDEAEGYWCLELGNKAVR